MDPHDPIFIEFLHGWSEFFLLAGTAAVNNSIIWDINIFYVAVLYWLLIRFAIYVISSLIRSTEKL